MPGETGSCQRPATGITLPTRVAWVERPGVPQIATAIPDGTLAVAVKSVRSPKRMGAC